MEIEKSDLTEGLLRFIDASPCAFYTVKNASEMLEQAGYTRIEEHTDWNLEVGGKYYLTRNQSTLVAFRMPEKIGGFMIGAAHTDSPSMHVKEHAELKLEGYTKLDVEKYGGAILASWLDRPLSVAGRLLVADENGVSGKLVNIDRDLCVIPGLAIHMDRSINDGKKLSIQTDLLPLLGQQLPDFAEIIAQELGIDKEQILSTDLYLYNREKGLRFGANNEFILSPRQDDLDCDYGLITGFLASEENGAMPVLCLFDNEEVGSQSRQGAYSTFLCDLLRRILLCRGMTESDYLRLLASSMLVSADNVHAVHPNHPEKAALTSRPVPNGGVVVKFGTGYATTGLSAALFRGLVQSENVPLQTYFNHSDIAGGSTIGKLADVLLPVCTVDIGLAQLSMHSAMETAGAEDVKYLSEAMRLYFSSRLEATGDSTYRLVR